MSGAYWDRLVPYLRHPAIAVDLPGRAGKPSDPMTLTVDECVGSVVGDVEAAAARGETADVILVGHSSGGLFVPGVAEALAPRVRHIVLSAGTVPPARGNALDAMKASHRDRVVAAMDAATRDGWVLTTPGPESPDKVRAYGGDDLDDDLVTFMTDPVRCVKDSMNFYFQPVSWVPVADVPVTFVKHLRDRPSPPALQDENIARLRDMVRHVRVVEIDSGHIPAVTHPELFAEILDSVASSAAAR
jgi:pimeloyl-ACP methyl ester carboxylesterase